MAKANLMANASENTEVVEEAATEVKEEKAEQQNSAPKKRLSRQNQQKPVETPVEEKKEEPVQEEVKEESVKKTSSEVKEEAKEETSSLAAADTQPVVEPSKAMINAATSSVAQIAKEVIKEEVEAIKKTPAATDDEKWFVFIGDNMDDKKMETVVHRLEKAEVDYIINAIGGVYVGPYDDKAKAINGRKKIIQKGLKGTVMTAKVSDLGGITKSVDNPND